MSWSSVLRKDCFRSGAGDLMLREGPCPGLQYCFRSGAGDLMLREGPCPGLQSFARTAPGQVLVT